MEHRTRIRNWIEPLAATGIVFFLNAAPAAAQCVMCYLTAGGAGSRGIRALQIGILVLLIPTLTMLAGVLWLAYRRRNSEARGSDDAVTSLNWEEGLMALPVSHEADNASPRL